MNTTAKEAVRTRPNNKEKSGHLVTLLCSYYRDEMRRAVAWRERLDRTTNWAVVLTAALLTWSFSDNDNPHYVILIGNIGVVMFLFIEARRYRFYDVWRSRLRLVEENLMADTLDGGDAVEEAEWVKMLAEDLRKPSLKISAVEALRRRLRRVYLPLLMVWLLAWLARITAYAPDGTSLYEAASISIIPGPLVAAVVAVFYLAVIILAFWPMQREAMGRLRANDAAQNWNDD